MKTNIKARLKRALKTAENELQMAKDGWVTNGHFAIHRGVLISQGLDLPTEVSADDTFFRGLGIAVRDNGGADGPDCEKVKPTGSLHKVTVTRMLWESAESGTLVCVQGDSGAFSTFVKLDYLKLMADKPWGLELEGKDALSSLVGLEGSFIVMPVRPLDEAEGYSRLGFHIDRDAK